MVVADNMNPIERAERSTLILAAAVHRVPCKDLIQGTGRLSNAKEAHPILFAESDGLH